MPNDTKITNGFKKWGVPIGVILIAGFITWVVKTVWELDRGVEAFHATYENNLKSMAADRNTLKREVAKNTQAWYNWENVDKVRERHTKQDVRIEMLQETVAELKTRLREVEHLYDQLGGPKDPLWNKIEKLITRIASLEEYIRR